MGLKRKSLHPQGNFPLLFFSVFQKGFPEEIPEETAEETAGESPEKKIICFGHFLSQKCFLFF